jgi:hypothetical protein
MTERSISTRRVGLAMQRQMQMVQCSEMSTWASSTGPGRPLSIGSIGMGACTFVSQARQLIFGRTLKCAGNVLQHLALVRTDLAELQAAAGSTNAGSFICHLSEFWRWSAFGVLSHWANPALRDGGGPRGATACRIDQRLNF